MSALLNNYMVKVLLIICGGRLPCTDHNVGQKLWDEKYFRSLSIIDKKTTHLQDGCITQNVHTKRILYAVVVCHLVITIDPEHVAKIYFRFNSDIPENSHFRYEIGNLRVT